MTFISETSSYLKSLNDCSKWLNDKNERQNVKERIQELKNLNSEECELLRKFFALYPKMHRQTASHSMWFNESKEYRFHEVLVDKNSDFYKNFFEKWSTGPVFPERIFDLMHGYIEFGKMNYEIYSVVDMLKASQGYGIPTLYEEYKKWVTDNLSKLGEQIPQLISCSVELQDQTLESDLKNYIKNLSDSEFARLIERLPKEKFEHVTGYREDLLAASSA